MKNKRFIVKKPVRMFLLVLMVFFCAMFASAEEEQGYGLYVYDIEVTPENAHDILGKQDVGATAVYDEKSNTLTLDGFSVVITEENVITRNVIFTDKDLNLVLKGENEIIYKAEQRLEAFWIDGNLNVSNFGKLRLEMRVSELSNNFCALYVDGDMNVKDCTIDIEVKDVHRPAIYVGENLNVNNAWISAKNKLSVECAMTVNGGKVEVHAECGHGKRGAISAFTITVTDGVVEGVSKTDDEGGEYAGIETYRLVITGGQVVGIEKSKKSFRTHGIRINSISEIDDERKRILTDSGKVIMTGGTLVAGCDASFENRKSKALGNEPGTDGAEGVYLIGDYKIQGIDGLYVYGECDLKQRTADRAVTIEVSSGESGIAYVPGMFWENPFSDVDESDSFYEAIKYISENKIMNGTGKDKFSPDEEMTCAMFITALHRIEHKPSVFGLDKCKEIEKESYYALAEIWAVQKGWIGERFGREIKADDVITFEKAADILKKLGKYRVHSGEKIYDAQKALGLDADKVLTRAECAALFKFLFDID